MISNFKVSTDMSCQTAAMYNFKIIHVKSPKIIKLLKSNLYMTNEIFQFFK